MAYESIWRSLREVSFSQGWLDAGGIRTRYLASGAAPDGRDAPALMLLHGTGGHAEAYVRNLKAHGERFRTYAIDMLGHGWTDKPDVSMEIGAYVDHLVRVLDALNIERAHISGESLGGWVAARFALEHPERLDNLVLNTTGGSVANIAVMTRLKELTLRAATEPTWDFVKARLEWLMHDKSHVNDDLVATRQAIYSAPGASEAMKRALVLQDMDVRLRNLLTNEDWSRIRARTLVLWTDHDPTNPVEEGRRIASMIPNAQFAVMTGCGHWPQWEDAATFDELHIAFLSGSNVDRGAA
jgi:2-hydroxy-6-oxonona-2,4-dienedioate hydrolase